MHTFDNLGGRARITDPRDHLIGAATTYDFPATKMQQAAFAAPIYYQGKKPACGAHAGTWAKVFLDILDGKSIGKGATPRYTWINIKRDDTNTSDGTSMDRIFAALQQYGIDTFDPLENDVTYDDQAYADPKKLTPSMLATGEANTIASYAYPQDLTFSGIKQTISDFGHCILLIDVCERFWTAADGTTSWAEKDILPLGWPSAKFPVTSAHFIVAHSYDEHYIYFANSFGPTWGRAGHGYFGPGYMPWVLEKGVMHNAPKPVDSSPVTAALPQITEAIAQLPTLPQPQQALGKSLIEQLIEACIAYLSGKR